MQNYCPFLGYMEDQCWIVIEIAFKKGNNGCEDIQELGCSTNISRNDKVLNFLVFFTRA